MSVYGLVYSLSNAVTFVWTVSVSFSMLTHSFAAGTGSFARVEKFYHFMTAIHKATWPLAPVGSVLTLVEWRANNLSLTFSALLGLILWWRARNWPDDDWEKRKQRFLESVKVVGGKLVVVPVHS